VVSHDKRWRAEDIGYFDGSANQVFTFVDRLQSVSSGPIGVKTVQANIVTLFKDKAFKWYHYELAEVTKWALNTTPTMDPWCNALIERFRPSANELLRELEGTRYTRKDASQKEDATEYIQDIMRLTKGLNWPMRDGLNAAFDHFEPSLQRDLNPADDLNSFIKQVQLRQSSWFEIYGNFGKARPPERPYGQPYRPPNTGQRPYGAPQHQQQQQNGYRPPQQQPRPYPQQPKAYFVDDEEDDQDDWVYDAPAHAFVAAPEYHQPSGHTPRRMGNTHDGHRDHTQWSNAGADHRCTHDSCTHYHQ